MSDDLMGLWWTIGTLCGIGAAFMVGCVQATASGCERLKSARARWRAIGTGTLQGVSLGAVAGYVMSWLSPHLPGWPVRFLVACIVGAAIAMSGIPQAEPRSNSIIFWLYGLSGCLAGLVSAGLVRHFSAIH